MGSQIKHAIAWTGVLALALVLACSAPQRCTEPGVATASLEAGALLDEEAALKLARDRGMKEGLTKWTAELREYPQYGTAWSVTNTLFDLVGSRGGQLFIIDARSGTLLDTMGWVSQWLTDDPGPLRITPVHSAEPPN